MKKYIVLTLIILVLQILDNSLIPFIGINGYVPSLLFVFALCYSIVNGDWSCLWIGLVTGFLQDLNFFNGFGANLFTNVLICFAAGKIGKNLFKEKIFIPTISICAMTFVKGLLLFAILYMCGKYTNINNAFYDALYNFVVSIFMYKAVYNLCQKDYMIKNWEF